MRQQTACGNIRSSNEAGGRVLAGRETLGRQPSSPWSLACLAGAGGVGPKVTLRAGGWGCSQPVRPQAEAVSDGGPGLRSVRLYLAWWRRQEDAAGSRSWPGATVSPTSLSWAVGAQGKPGTLQAQEMERGSLRGQPVNECVSVCVCQCVRERGR